MNSEDKDFSCSAGMLSLSSPANTQERMDSRPVNIHYAYLVCITALLHFVNAFKNLKNLNFLSVVFS